MATVGEPEAVWREALKARGKDWVVAELQKRPGRPDDTLYDVVFEAPLPTREFCQRWCAEEDNRLFSFTWQKKVALIFLILTVICFTQAIKNWNPPRGQGLPAAPRVAAPPRGPAPKLDNGAGGASAASGNGTGASSTGTGGASSTASSTVTSLPSLCSYQTYQTAACKTK